MIRSLERLFRQQGRPACLRCDNGTELIEEAMLTWLKDKHVDTHYIEPGSPWLNVYSENFNSIFWTTCLDRWIFSSLNDTRVAINQWLEEYSKIRPYGSPCGMNPEQYLQKSIVDNNTNLPSKSLKR